MEYFEKEKVLFYLETMSHYLDKDTLNKVKTFFMGLPADLVFGLDLNSDSRKEN